MGKEFNLKNYQWGVPANQDITTQQNIYMRLIGEIIMRVVDQDEDVVCITLQCLVLLKMSQRQFSHHGKALKIVTNHPDLFPDALERLYELIETDDKREIFFNALFNALYTLKHPDTGVEHYLSNEITHFKIKKETVQQVNAAYQYITDKINEYFPFSSTFNNEILSFAIDNYTYQFRVKFTNDKESASILGLICITSLKNFDRMLKFITVKSLAQVLITQYQESYGNLSGLSFAEFNQNKIYKSIYELIVLYVKTKQVIEKNDDNLAKLSQDNSTQSLVARNENLREKTVNFNVFSKSNLPVDFEFILESLQVAISEMVSEQQASSDSLNCSPMTMASMSLTNCRATPQSLPGSPFAQTPIVASRTLLFVMPNIIELPQRVNLPPNMFPFAHALNEDISVLSVTVNNIEHLFTIQQTQEFDGGTANNEIYAQFIAFKVFVFLLDKIYKQRVDVLTTLNFESFDENFVKIYGLLNRYFVVKEIIKENKKLIEQSSSEALRLMNVQLEIISETFETFYLEYDPLDDPKGLDYYQYLSENVRVASLANPASQATKFFYYKPVNTKEPTRAALPAVDSVEKITQIIENYYSIL